MDSSHLGINREGVWCLKEGILHRMLPSGEMTVPAAAAVYDAEFGGDANEFARPSTVLPFLAFSRFPLTPRIVIDSPPPGSARPLCSVVIANDFAIAQPIAVDALAPDHVVIESTWYPMPAGILREIRQVLAEACIEGPGPLTLRQYLNLKVLIPQYDFIEDRLKQSYSDKGTEVARQDDLSGFAGTMYPYQAMGFGWLCRLADEQIGCIVADEMGLGKTIQVLALLLREARNDMGPALVIAPATLLENWRREAAKFVPSLRTMVHRGPARTGRPSGLQNVDLLITSYDTAMRDLSLLQMIKWHVVVLDEAQAIKNPAAQRTTAAKQIGRDLGIAMTGTPVEICLRDLWSIGDFVLPGYLGSLGDFESRYDSTLEDASLLEPLISPILLRREVKDVARDLPPKILIPQAIELDAVSAAEYENIREQVTERYEDGAGFAVLMRLRQYCTHPFLLQMGGGDPALRSNKYQRLAEVVDEVVSRREKVLVFTSFTGMIDLMIRDLPQRLGIACDWIDGRVDVPDRQRRVDRFNSYSGPALLALNPKAGGTGLNITGANHVIHYNPEWNPATEDQATARAHRRGQELPVTVHRFFIASTVEEVMNDRQERRRELAGTVVVGTDGKSRDVADLLWALRITPTPTEVD